ncbi:MAG TPA: NAD(P)/FAD-dependent oxidoreductase [Pedobacter sp.]|nr:NAD(P)/FAD-dependent oxidoreductase [Pedobacter sp.]
MKDIKKYEVIIIGGSYAGLSAAMALGRSMRSVLIIDGGEPCNRQTPHSHNFITQDGEKPGVIASKARAEVLKYPTVTLINDIAINAEQNESGFTISTNTVRHFSAVKLVFATGIKDIMPEIKGFEECWGISVVHCPYCHGYEIRGKKTAILATGERAFHLASLVSNLTPDVTILTNGDANFDAGQLSKFDKHKITVVDTVVTEIAHEAGQIRQVVFKDGTKKSFDALYAAVPFTQQSDVPISLGCTMTEQGYIKVDSFQATTVNGILACGDNSAMMRSVANAVYTGNLTGAMVNRQLTDEQF